MVASKKLVLALGTKTKVNTSQRECTTMSYHIPIIRFLTLAALPTPFAAPLATVEVAPLAIFPAAPTPFLAEPGRALTPLLANLTVRSAPLAMALDRIEVLLELEGSPPTVLAPSALPMSDMVNGDGVAVG